MWIASHLSPLEGNEERVKELQAEVSYLSGLAEPGVAQTNTYISATMENGASMKISPVAAWLACMQPKPLLNADNIVTACRSAEGRLQVQGEEQKRLEGSLAWGVARVIGWPRKVRELAGFKAESRAGKATVWTLSGLLFALITGVAGSFIYAIVIGVTNIDI